MEHLEPITRFASEGGLVLSEPTSGDAVHSKKKLSRFLRTKPKPLMHEEPFDVEKVRPLSS
jgi:hypothetical protein